MTDEGKYFLIYFRWLFTKNLMNVLCLLTVIKIPLKLASFKEEQLHIAAALRSTWALLFWSTWPAAVDRSRS